MTDGHYFKFVLLAFKGQTGSLVSVSLFLVKEKACIVIVDNYITIRQRRKIENSLTPGENRIQCRAASFFGLEENDGSFVRKCSNGY